VQSQTRIGWIELEMTKVPIKGIKVYRSRGKLYAYHRATGIRLRSHFGTTEFFAELVSIEAQTSKPKEKPGTWGGLVLAYKDSPRFQDELKQRTRQDYNRLFDWLAPLAAMPLIEITREFVCDLRDKAHTTKKRRFANYVLSVLSVVFSYGMEHGLAYENPASRIKKVRRPKDMPRANRPWTQDEWELVSKAAPKHILAPLLLCGLLGWREGEAISAPRTAYNRENGCLVRTAAKSGREVKTPAPKVIVAALEALFPHDATTLLVSSTGRPWTLNGFRSSFFKLIRKLETKGQIGPGLTCHGLRHTAATNLREAGFDLQTIADFLGQDTQGMAAHYSRSADLAGTLRKVVQHIDEENNPSSKVSNNRKDSV
jgi:integrase